MTRINAALVAAGLALGAVGCAHCDTCDDFPTPCIGPNCGGGPYGAYAMASGPMNNSAPVGVTVAAPSGASLGPANDAAGPVPAVPAPGPAVPAPGTPAVNPPINSQPANPTATPPLPGEPTAPRTRPGS